MLLAYTADRRRVSTQHAKSAVAEYENLFTSSASPAPEARTVAQKSRFRRAAAGIAALGAAGIGVQDAMWALREPHPVNYPLSSRPSASDVSQAHATDASVRTISNQTFSIRYRRRRCPRRRLIPPRRNRPCPPPWRFLPEPPVPEVNPAPHRLRQIRVKLGDTVGEIAARYLGSREKVAAVVAANPQLADVNRIYPGDVIYVPESNSPATAEQ